MALVVLSRSGSFVEHVRHVAGERITFKSELIEPGRQRKQIILVQASSFEGRVLEWMDAIPSTDQTVIGIAADHPNVVEMLEYSHKGAQAYFNSYMVATHYKQMLRLIKSGESWYPPHLLAQTFEMARQSVAHKRQGDPLKPLTQRERDVALAVAEGMSNKAVARYLGVTERTVKAHLTRIFKKLNVKDRVALVLFLQKYDLRKLDNSLN